MKRFLYDTYTFYRTKSWRDKNRFQSENSTQACTEVNLWICWHVISTLHSGCCWVFFLCMHQTLCFLNIISKFKLVVLRQHYQRVTEWRFVLDRWQCSNLSKETVQKVTLWDSTLGNTWLVDNSEQCVLEVEWCWGWGRGCRLTGRLVLVWHSASFSIETAKLDKIGLPPKYNKPIERGTLGPDVPPRLLLIR